MAAKDSAPKKVLQLGDVATFEVVAPHCGLEKGHQRRMKLTKELQGCIDKGLWKLVK